MVSLARADILADISDKELSALESTNLAAGQSSPLPTVIAQQTKRAYNMTARYLVDDETMTRLIVPLVIWEMAKRLGAIPQKWTDAQKQALAELTDIRDGKYKGIYAEASTSTTNPPPVTAAPGRFGSQRHVRFPRIGP